MSPDVNPPRAYDASRRREQARQTRRRILGAAADLLFERGYAATTIPAVAAAADVSVETVYKAVGNKPGLAKAVFDTALVGDDEPVAMIDRQEVRTLFDDPDPVAKVRAYGRLLAEAGARTNPLLLVLRDAAVADPAAVQLWNTLQEERLAGMTVFAERLAVDGHLRSEVTVAEASDVLWAHGSVELWDLLVRRRAWTDARFGEWLGRQLEAALVAAD